MAHPDAGATDRFENPRTGRKQFGIDAASHDQVEDLT
jgi:hypothetical protein